MSYDRRLRQLATEHPKILEEPCIKQLVGCFAYLLEEMPQDGRNFFRRAEKS